jgi:hypothetical protein
VRRVEGVSGVALVEAQLDERSMIEAVTSNFMKAGLLS